MTVEKIKDELNDALTIPGVSNSFTMPIKARIDMLSTGIRTPVGIKVMGPDIGEIEKIGLALEERLKTVPGTRSVYAERVTTGYFLDVVVRRDRIARYGLTVDDVQKLVSTAIGGENLTTTVEGRGRYPVNVRYPRELRNDPESIKRILVPVMMPGAQAAPAPAFAGMSATRNILQVPLGELVDVRIVKGPTAIKSEEGMLAAYVYIDFSGRDFGGYVTEAKAHVADLKIPEGYRLTWSGEYENLVRTHEKLKMVIPLTLLIIIILIYFNTKSATKTMIVLLAVPFSLVGSFWFLYLLNYNMSIAVWVGIIALAGLDAETGVIMLLYLDLAYDEWVNKGQMKTMADLQESIMHGAVKRIRPKIMTVSVILAGLVPIMFSHGAGADVMKRIAAPMVGGVITSTILELIIYPAIYRIWRGRGLAKP
jgi:Cu(I)/Ag(I) efflux system membrane protein CusA/SilA